VNERKYLSLTSGLPAPVAGVNIMVSPPGFAMQLHAHAFYHVNRVCRGAVRFEIDGKEYEAGEGTVFALPPHRPHRLYSPEGYSQIGVDILCGEDPHGISTALAQICTGFVSAKTDQPTEPLYERVHALLAEPTQWNMMRLANLAEAQVLDLTEGVRQAECDPFAAAFTEMLARNDPCTLRLGDMCRLLGISRTQLERRAQKAFGCGASEYCARLRYEKICTLLLGGATLDEAARLAGFCDAPHLSKFFRARCGMPPGEYRRRFSVNGAAVNNLLT